MVAVRSCDLCGKPSTKTCGNCKSAFYCSVDHQKLFWQFHKLVCGLDHNDFTLVRVPDLQPEEAISHLDSFTHSNLTKGKTESYELAKAALKKSSQEGVKREALKELASLFNAEFSTDPITRTEQLNAVRTSSIPKEDGPIVNGPLSVYHRLALPQQQIAHYNSIGKFTPPVKYSYAFFKEFLAQLCVMHVAESLVNTATYGNILSHCKASAARLGKIVEEIESTKDFDTVGFYRSHLEREALIVTQLNKMYNGLITSTKAVENIEAGTEDSLRKYHWFRE